MTEPLIVILAGGEGRRIGGGKPLRVLAGKSLIARAVEAASSWSSDIRVALRSADQIADSGLEVILDDESIQGPLAGLSSAFCAASKAGRRHLLTLPCDVPFLPPDLWPRLRSELGDHLAAMPSTEDRLHPACTLWRTEASEQLGAYMESGRRSLIGFAEFTGFSRVEWPSKYFFNVNDEADLAEAERRLA